MVNDIVDWRKTYTISPYDEVVEFIVIHLKVDYYVGIILYCKRNENRIDHIDGGNFTVIIKKFGEEIESDIIKQFEDWLSLTFPSSTYNIVLREDKTLI